MKVMKTIPVPATPRSVLDYVKCELCGQTSPVEDWSPRAYRVTEPDVVLRVGSSYPEGTDITSTILDICPMPPMPK